MMCGKSLQSKNLRGIEMLRLYLGGTQQHILMRILSYSFSFLVFLPPVMVKSSGQILVTVASGCGESLELWASESFSGLGSRNADEARLNIANRS